MLNAKRSDSNLAKAIFVQSALVGASSYNSFIAIAETASTVQCLPAAAPHQEVAV